MLKKMSFVFVLLVAFSAVFAENDDNSNAFNEYMSPEGGINPMSGTVAFSKTLASIGDGDVKSSFTLNYSGNIFESVKKRNNISTTGWVGLGWSMGFARIVADNNGSMFLDDDSYLLISQEDISYKIIKDKNGKWWVENNPFWLVTPKIDNKSIKNQSVIVGWTIIDANGIKYEYGDMAYCQSNADGKECPQQNATQYALSLSDYGHVDLVYDENDILYPKAWNLSKQVDLDGNYLKYYYNQFLEGLSVSSNGFSKQSTNKYTKECYLEHVESSNGAKVQFNLGSKDPTEYADVIGKDEKTNSATDASVDPIERHYLSFMTIYGRNGDRLSTIRFNYKTLDVRRSLLPSIERLQKSLKGKGTSLKEAITNTKKLYKSDKRLLTSVVWSNQNNEEVSREEYVYNENTQNVGANPVGSLIGVRGRNCGEVQFTYQQMPISTKADGQMHSESIEAINVAVGNMKDGTKYLVGMSEKEKGVVLYIWRSGQWKRMQVLTDGGFEYDEKGFFVIGKNNWFAYVDGEENVYPVVFDGKKWKAGSENPIKKKENERISFGSSYLVKASLGKDSKISLSVPWSAWGESYDNLISFETGYESIDDSFSLLPSRNHIAVFYKTKEDDVYKMKIFSFKYQKGNLALKESYKKENIGKKSTFGWGNEILFATIEDLSKKHSYVVAYHFTGKEWKKLLNKQKTSPEIKIVGDNYFATSGHDGRYLTLFYWNGDAWEIPYENEDMIFFEKKNDKYIGNGRWNASRGNDFFVTRSSLMKPVEKNGICYKLEFKQRNGIYYMPEWSDCHDFQGSYNNTKLYVFQNRYDEGWNSLSLDDKWKSLKYIDEDDKNERLILTGNDWLVDVRSQVASIWNGVTWNDEKLDITIDKEKPLSANSFGDFFTIQQEGKTTIYYKKNDSFIRGKETFFVTKKTIVDPVEDTKYSYLYSYEMDDNEADGFDYISNTPLVKKIKIVNPVKSGTIVQTLCDENNDIGLGKGQLCQFEKKANNVLEAKEKKHFIRIRNDSWPDEIYYDAMDTEEYEVKGFTKATVTKFNEQNGLPRNVSIYSGKNVRKKEKPDFETVIKYVVDVDGKDEDGKDIATSFRDLNRLSSIAFNYSCKPNCSNGYVTTSLAAKIGHVSGISRLVPDEEWVYNYSSQKQMTVSNFKSKVVSKLEKNDYSGIDRYMKMNKTYVGFAGGKITEEKNEFGNHSAIVYDDDKKNVRANVENATVDEILVVPGDACKYSGMNVSSCEITPLRGNAVDAIGNKKVYFGRFADNAIDLGKSSFKANLTSVGKKYHFSAWLQKTDEKNAEMALNINGVNETIFSLAKNGVGEWVNVDWFATIPKGNVNLEFVAQNGNVRIQDVRFVPADASVQTIYYDKMWNKPVVTVNDNGVASYVSLDENGRVIKQYAEKENGSLFLKKSKKYYEGSCVVASNTSGGITGLKINDILLNKKSFLSEIVVSAIKKVVDLIPLWAKGDKSKNVEYRLYSEGSNAGNWTKLKDLTKKAVSVVLDAKKNMIMEIKEISSGVSNIYKVKFQKKQTGWSNIKKVAASGLSPVFASANNISKLYLVDESGLSMYSLSSESSWVKNKTLNGYFSKAKPIGRSYMLALPGETLEDEDKSNSPILYQESSLMEEKGAVSSKNIADGIYKGIVDNSQIPYALYKSFDEIKKDYSLYFAKYVNNAWTLTGATPKIDVSFDMESQLVPGEIGTCNVRDADMILGPENKIFASYICSNPFGKINDDFNIENALVIKELFDASDVDFKNNSQNMQIWASPSQYINANGKWQPYYFGDYLTVNNNVVYNVHRVKLAQDGANLYIAIIYERLSDVEDEPSKRVLSVLKGSFEYVYESNANGLSGQTKKLKFRYLEDQSVQDKNIIAYVDQYSSFDFALNNGIPYVLFSNSQNNDALTVVKYENNRWMPVGEPAFAIADKSEDAVSLAFDYNGNPVVAMVSSNESTENPGEIVVLKYAQNFQGKKDVDLTLSSVFEVNDKTNLRSEYKPYILNYASVVASEVNTVALKIIASTRNDVRSISIFDNDSLIDTWNGDARTLNVSLVDDLNDVQIVIEGSDGSLLKYELSIYRNPMQDSNAGIILTAESPIEMIDSTIDYQMYAVYGYGNVRNICINFNLGWHFVWHGDRFNRGKCFDVDFSNLESDTLFVQSDLDENKIVTIEIADGNSIGSKENKDSTEYISGDVDPVVVPEKFASLNGYKLVALENLTIGDRTVVSGGIYHCKNALVGANASMKGRLDVINNVELQSNSNLETLVYGGSLSMSQGAKYETLRNESVDDVSIPTVDFGTGKDDIIVYVDGTRILSPGDYKEIHIYSRSKVTITAGVYNVEQFVIEPEAEVVFENSLSPIQIFSSGKVSIANNIKLNTSNPAENLFIYTSSSDDVFLGVNAEMNAVVVAPNAKVAAYSGFVLNGKIWAKNIELQPDETIK